MSPRLPFPTSDFLEQHQKITEQTAYNSGLGNFRKPGLHPAQMKNWGDNPIREGNPIQTELLAEVWKVAEAINVAAGRDKRDPRGAVVIASDKVKGFVRASEKVKDKLNGNWSLLNDLSRCTLVVPKQFYMKDALNEVIKHFGGELRGNSGVLKRVRQNCSLFFHSYKPIKPEDNDCAYAHEAITVRTADHQRAEVQINYPDMMYAKSLEECDKLEQGIMSALATRYAPVPGGLGHKMYENWRTGQRPKENAAACKLYYEYFRSFVPLWEKGQEVLDAVRKLNLNVPRVVIPPPPPPGSWIASRGRDRTVLPRGPAPV